MSFSLKSKNDSRENAITRLESFPRGFLRQLEKCIFVDRKYTGNRPTHRIQPKFSLYSARQTAVCNQYQGEIWIGHPEWIACLNWTPFQISPNCQPNLINFCRNITGSVHTFNQSSGKTKTRTGNRKTSEKNYNGKKAVTSHTRHFSKLLRNAQRERRPALAQR